MLKAMTIYHLQETLEIINIKKLIDTATQTEIDAAKTASKRVVKKTAEATAVLTGNKIADKITSVGKKKLKEKKMKQIKVKKSTYHQKKDSKIIDDLRSF